MPFPETLKTRWGPYPQFTPFPRQKKPDVKKPLATEPAIIDLSATSLAASGNTQVSQQIRSDADFIAMFITARSTTGQNWRYKLYNQTISGYNMSALPIFGPVNVNGETGVYANNILMPLPVPWRFPAGTVMEVDLTNDHVASDTIRFLVHGYYEVLQKPGDSISYEVGPSEAPLKPSPEQMPFVIDVPYVLDLSKTFTGSGILSDMEAIPGDGDFFANWIIARSTVSADWTFNILNVMTGKYLSKSAIFGPLAVGGESGYFTNSIPILGSPGHVPARQALRADITNNGGAQTIRLFVWGYRRLKLLAQR